MKSPFEGRCDFAVRKSVGRPNKLDENEVERLLSLYYEKNLSLRELGRIFNVSRTTVWRVCNGYVSGAMA